ncbi:hypothetical protein [Bacillus cereus]|uniref:hypothetical protein n=1 Tax=Bacillus cereus TaxID=1396 RepID=UPI000BF55D7F|nr:hypothetical protein [Bacillus cereus]PFK68268.1 hypothetical protein COJ25_17175 [Bacillus cereus]
MSEDNLKVFVESDEVLGKLEVTLREIKDNDENISEEDSDKVREALKSTVKLRSDLNKLSGELIKKEIGDNIFSNWTDQLRKP